MYWEQVVEDTATSQSTTVTLKNYQLNKTISYRSSSRSCTIKGEDKFEYTNVLDETLNWFKGYKYEGL